MALTERLAILIDANGAGAIREFQKVGIAAERDLGKAESRADKMSSTMIKTGVGMVTASVLIAKGMWNAAQSSAQLEAQVKTTDSTFGAAAGTIDEFASTSAESVGMSSSAFRNWSSVLGATLTNMGATKQEAADMSVEFIKLGADLATAFGKAPEEAITAMGAAFRGEYDPIEKFGVSVKEADVQAKIAAMGLSTATRAAERHSKALAIMALIQEQTSSVQGRFANGTEDAVVKQAKMNAKIEDAKNQLGAGFMPVLSKVVDTLATGADVFKRFDESTGGSAATVVGWAVVTLGAAGAASVLAGAATKAAVNLGLKATAAEVAAAATAKAAAADVGATGAATGLTAANMTLAGSFMAVAAGAAIGLAAVMKINAASGENQTEFFGKIDFTDIEGANQKLNETGERINGLMDQWNNYSAAEKLAHGLEWKNLQDLIQQQNEHRAHLDAEVKAINEVGSALGITAKEAEGLATQLKIDVSAYPLEKVVKALKDFREGKSAAEVMLDLQGAMEAVVDEALPLADQLKNLDKTTRGLVDASKAYENSQIRIVDAQQGVADAAARIVDAQRAQVQAGERIIEAQRAEVQAHERVKDAVRSVIEAKERLLIVQQGGEGGTEYADNVEQASINLRRAQDAEVDAQKRLAEARTPDEKRRAGIALEQAQLDLRRAGAALNQANASQSVDAAQATDDLAKAQAGLSQAEYDAQKAGEAVAQAQIDAGKAAEAVARAQRDATKAQRDLSNANYDAINALMVVREKQEEQKKSLRDNADAVGALIAKYGELAAMSPGYAAAIGPLIAMLGGTGPRGQAGLSPKSTADLFNPDTWRSGPQRAAGGPVSAGQTYLVGERGPELLEMGGMGGHVTPMGGGDGGRIVEVHNHIEVGGREVAVHVTRHQIASTRGGRR